MRARERQERRQYPAPSIALPSAGLLTVALGFGASLNTSAAFLTSSKSALSVTVDDEPLKSLAYGVA